MRLSYREDSDTMARFVVLKEMFQEFSESNLIPNQQANLACRQLCFIYILQGKVRLCLGNFRLSASFERKGAEVMTSVHSHPFFASYQKTFPLFAHHHTSDLSRSTQIGSYREIRKRLTREN